jgi:hypothetical protein
VIPGHPFFTEQLDRQRENQRLILAGIQERTLETVGIARTTAVPPIPRGGLRRRFVGSPNRSLQLYPREFSRSLHWLSRSRLFWPGSGKSIRQAGPTRRSRWLGTRPARHPTTTPMSTNSGRGVTKRSRVSRSAWHGPMISLATTSIPESKRAAARSSGPTASLSQACCRDG